MANAPKVIYLSTRDELYRLDISRIVYLEADGNYTRIFMKNGLVVMLCTGLAKMNELIKARFPADTYKFVRIGKKYIVNLAFFFSLNTLKQKLVLSDQSSFSVTLDISKEALKSLKDYLVSKNQSAE